VNTQNQTHKKQWQRTEQGQALVLIILAIIAIFGFAALALDFGRIYAERRRAQSAADAAALAWAFAASQVDYGGAYTLPEVRAKLPAYASLTKNDYTDIPDWVKIELFWPPDHGPYGPESGLDLAKRQEYYQVVLHSRVAPIFAQLVFEGILKFQVEAVARAMPVSAISPGNALMATGETECPGIIFNGNMDTEIVGGNIFSNSDRRGPGSCYSGITTGGSGSIKVTDGEILISGGWSDGGGYVSPAPKTGVKQQTIDDVPEPNCSGYPARSLTNPLQPGVYSDIKITHGDWIMLPGMYCLNGDFNVNGGSLKGDGVMIVMNHGSLSMSGSGNVDLKRPSAIVDSEGTAFNGFLIYMPYDNDGGIDLGGTSNMTYSGTIYAPGVRHPDSEEKCQIGGTGGSIGLSANVICSSIKIHGTADIYIKYKAEQNAMRPARAELSQ
jgi:hypothetical protein